MTCKLLPFAPALFALLAALPASGQVVDQLKYSIPAPPGGAQREAGLGFSVAVGGRYCVVGAPDDDSGAQNSGVAKVFDVATGKLLHVLANPEPTAGALFGWSVSVSGSRVAVGTQNSPNKVSVYDLGGPAPTVPVVTLAPPPGAGSILFGWSVAISGTLVVVGNPFGISQSGDSGGTAHVYDLASATPTVPILNLGNPSDTTSAHFGSAVAISGSRVVITTKYEVTETGGTGGVYVYDVASATPATPILTLHSPVPSYRFGTAVAISHSRMVVGAMNDLAGSAYVYDLSTTTPSVPVSTLHNPIPGSHDFGTSVGIYGATIVVGAIGDDRITPRPGYAHVYYFRTANPALPDLTLTSPNPAGGDAFGQSVAIFGGWVVVGAADDGTLAFKAGSAYLYKLGTDPPEVPAAVLNAPSPATNDFFGNALAISGSKMVVGVTQDDTMADSAGIAYIYDLGPGASTAPELTLRSPAPMAFEHFGGSVAISGPHVVVGTLDSYYRENHYSNVGTVYLYDLESIEPTVSVATLNNPTPADGDYFGVSLAVSGTNVVVGAPGDDIDGTNAGAAYIYDLASASPTVPVLRLENPNPATEGRFGGPVAISGPLVIVGAPGHAIGVQIAGFAYLYDLASATPAKPVLTFNDPTPVPFDYFGGGVAISGRRVLVSDSRDETGAFGTARVYAYDLDSPTPTVPVATFTNPHPANQFFPSSIAISGTRVVIGARVDAPNVMGAGRAFVYDLASSTPAVPVAVLGYPGFAEGEFLGARVAIDGNTLAVGNPEDSTALHLKGSIHIFGPSPFSEWKVSELRDPFATDLGDADRNGLCNLMEYGLLGSPANSDGAAMNAAPALYAEGTRLRMFVPRDPTRNDVTLEVQATGDLLGPWTTIATSTLGAPFAGPGYFSGDSATPGIKSVEVRDTVNVTDAPQRFLRVRVVH